VSRILELIIDAHIEEQLENKPDTDFGYCGQRVANEAKFEEVSKETPSHSAITFAFFIALSLNHLC
jgi:hypothetical protein